jgi:hypothetical protein
MLGLWEEGLCGGGGFCRGSQVSGAGVHEKWAKRREHYALYRAPVDWVGGLV